MAAFGAVRRHKCPMVVWAEMSIPAGLNGDAIADPARNGFLNCVAEGSEILNVVQSDKIHN